MNIKLDEPIQTLVIFDREKTHLKPVKIKWKNKTYPISQIDYVFREKRGRILHHVFCCLSDHLYFKIVFNTESLIWNVEEVSDGEVD